MKNSRVLALRKNLEIATLLGPFFFKRTLKHGHRYHVPTDLAYIVVVALALIASCKGLLGIRNLFGGRRGC